MQQLQRPETFWYLKTFTAVSPILFTCSSRTAEWPNPYENQFKIHSTKNHEWNHETHFETRINPLVNPTNWTNKINQTNLRSGERKRVFVGVRSAQKSWNHSESHHWVSCGNLSNGAGLAFFSGALCGWTESFVAGLLRSIWGSCL